MVEFKEIRALLADERHALAEDLIKQDDKVQMAMQVAAITMQSKLACMLVFYSAEIQEGTVVDLAEILYKSYSKKQLDTIFFASIDGDEYNKAKSSTIVKG